MTALITEQEVTVSFSNKPTRFVIVGTQRTGTTLLRTSLSSHPEICCHGEVFKLGKRPYSLAGGYWEYSRRMFRNRIQSIIASRRLTAAYLCQLYADTAYRAIGLKVMLSQCKTRPYIWPLLTDLGVRAVLVKRRNILKTLVSRRAAETSGVYHVSTTLKVDSAVNRWQSKAIHIDTKTLVSDIEAIESEDAEWRARLKGRCDFIEVVYEDYLRDIHRDNRRVLEFLEVQPRELHSDLKKVNPDDLRQLISNFDAVAKALVGTKYAEWVDAR